MPKKNAATKAKSNNGSLHPVRLSKKTQRERTEKLKKEQGE